MKSFTLVEIILVIAVFGILISFLVPVGLNFYKSQQLEAVTQELIQTLRRAQLKAMSVEMDSSFGVYLTNDNYTLFKGNSYEDRDTQYDEVFDLSQIIRISGLSEVVFLKFEGLPEKTTSAFCGGVCTPCSQFTNRTSCLKQGGCSWNRWLRRCLGNCTPCDNYKNQTDCKNQSGCSWYPEVQGGNIILNIDSEKNIININEIGRVNLQ